MKKLINSIVLSFFKQQSETYEERWNRTYFSK